MSGSNIWKIHCVSFKVISLRGHNLGRREVGDMINRWVERIWAGDVSTESLGDGERAGGVVSGWESSSESG